MSTLILLYLILLVDDHRKDRAKAVEILNKDLKVFKTINEDLFKEMTLLLTMGNFRYFSTL